MKKNFPKTCLVVPCYNEEDRLEPNAFIDYLLSNDWMHICFVDDGSLDNTNSIIESIVNKCSKNASLISLKKNMGKAEAVRRGILLCNESRQYEYIGFADADLATPLWETNEFLLLKAKYGDIVMFSGCRLKRLGADIKRKWWRHYLGRIFATTTSLMLNLPVYDTQCGFKLFKASKANDLFKKPFCSKWFFDVEIFARMAELYGLERCKSMILEVPLLEWRDQQGSKLNSYQYFMAPIELLKIYLKHNVTK